MSTNHIALKEAVPDLNAEFQSSGSVSSTQTPPAEKDAHGVADQDVTTALEAREVTGFRFFMVLFAVYSTALLYGLDTTIVADVQGAVVVTFGEAEKLSWIGTAFPLGSIAVLLIFGKAFGVFDMKWLYIFSVTLFETGSALCGGSPNLNVSFDFKRLL
jgi:hypothetical protein